MTVNPFELSITKTINSLFYPTLDPVLLLSYYSIYLFLFLVFFLTIREKSKLNFLRFILILAVGISLIIFAKDLIKRPRPYFEDPSIIPSIPKTDYSIPSTHTFLAFTAYFFISEKVRKHSKILSLYLLLIIPLFLMAMGLHYISDLIASAAISIILFNLISVKSIKNIVKKL